MLILTCALYNEGPSVELAFDRPIDITLIDVSQIRVDDGSILMGHYQGFGLPVLTSQRSVLVGLNRTGASSQPAVQLSVGPRSQIVAAENRTSFAGVADLNLPFP